MEGAKMHTSTTPWHSKECVQPLATYLFAFVGNEQSNWNIMVEDYQCFGIARLLKTLHGFLLAQKSSNSKVGFGTMPHKNAFE
jgi:hypothetical protein